MTNETDPDYIVLRDFVIAEAKHIEVKAQYNAARTALLALVPQEVGKFEKQVGDFTLTVEYPEKIVWDAEQLDALYGTDKPAHVKLSYSIDLRNLRRLPLAEQEALSKCRDIRRGTPAIDIVKA